jgi:hypothetical protein
MEVEPMAHEEAPLRRFLRKPQAKAMFGDPPDSSWYKGIADGVIPAPVKMSPSRFAPALWDEAELIAAQQRLLAERDERVAERQQRRAEAGDTTQTIAARQRQRAEGASQSEPEPDETPLVEVECGRKARGRPRRRPRKTKATTAEHFELA